MSYRSAAVMPRTDWSAAVRGRARVGHALEVHEAIGSTNDRGRALLDEPGGDGGVVLAETQTTGRGRRGRAWLSPPGVNLTLTVALRPAVAASEAWQLGFAAGLAVLDAASSVAPASALGLKWPNDLVVEGGGSGAAAKVGGVLVETEVTGDALTAAVIGIGLNVNWRREEMPPEIAEGATSLREVARREIDRVALLDRLLDALDEEVRAIEAGLSPLARYRAACVTLGQEVLAQAAGGPLHGRAVDVDEGGSLVLETTSGRVAISAGEVSAVRSGPAL